MKIIDVKNLSKQQKFVTKDKFEVKLIQYVPEANPKNRLLFLLHGNILGCDEQGKCWTLNNYDASYTDSDFSKYDVFVDNIMHGYANLYNVSSKFKIDGVYSSKEEAEQNVSSNKQFVKTIKIEWSVE
jgi:hypothetical protein